LIACNFQSIKFKILLMPLVKTENRKNRADRFLEATMAVKQAMARGATFSARTFLLVGEAFSLDHRGWKAAPTEKDPTYLEENALPKPQAG
jgi:hypothetical protein